MPTPRFPGPANSSSPIAWALLSQTIWLPLIAIDVHDHWQAKLREQREIAAAATRLQPPVAIAAAHSAEGARSSGAASTGLLLGASTRGLQTAGQNLQAAALSLADRSSEGSSAPARQLAPAPQAQAQAQPTSPRLRPLEMRPAGLLSASFSRSELLGGSLGLEDLNRPAMPSLAMAEQARWANSPDPLAPLPNIWREPMRRAINALKAPNTAAASIQSARVIHIPSSRVRASTTIPLAIQRDGSVDILSRADDPGAVEEIRHWSKAQPAGVRSGVTAALVHLEPLPAPTPALTPDRSIRATAPAQPQTKPETAASPSARQAMSAPALEPPAARPAPAVAMDSPAPPAQPAAAAQAPVAPAAAAPLEPVAPLPAPSP